MFVTKNIGEPFATFSEPSFTSIGNAFFIRSAVSPDGRYIASGSSSGSVYIWEVAHPERPAYLLSAHRAECSSVSWCPSGTEQAGFAVLDSALHRTNLVCLQLASCSDDATVRIWRMDRELVNETKRDPETMRKTSVAFEGKIASPAGVLCGKANRSSLTGLLAQQRGAKQR